MCRDLATRSLIFYFFYFLLTMVQYAPQCNHSFFWVCFKYFFYCNMFHSAIIVFCFLYFFLLCCFLFCRYQWGEKPISLHSCNDNSFSPHWYLQNEKQHNRKKYKKHKQKKLWLHCGTYCNRKKYKKQKQKTMIALWNIFNRNKYLKLVVGID